MLPCSSCHSPVHTYASRALEDLFPCLVACGLVKGRLVTVNQVPGCASTELRRHCWTYIEIRKKDVYRKMCFIADLRTTLCKCLARRAISMEIVNSLGFGIFESMCINMYGNISYIWHLYIQWSSTSWCKHALISYQMYCEGRASALVSHWEATGWGWPTTHIQCEWTTSAGLQVYMSIWVSHLLQWLALDSYSNSSMCHSELSSHPPINRENVCSVWETKAKLRFSFIHSITTHTVIKKACYYYMC